MSDLDPAAIPAVAPVAVPVAPVPQPAPIAAAPAAQPAPIAAPAASPTIEAPITNPLSGIVTINSSAAQGLLMSVATGVVRVGGAFLIAHGAMTQAQVSEIGPIVAQEIAGTALLVAGQCWASLREWLSHQKKLAAAFADPSTIVLK